MIVSAGYNSCLVDNAARESSLEEATRLGNPRKQLPSQPVYEHVMLEYAIESLNKVKSFVNTNRYLLELVKKLIVFLEEYRTIPSSADRSVRQERLKPLKDILFWVPVKILPTFNSDPAVIVTIVYVHAIALVVEPVKKAASGFFRGLNALPIIAFHEELSNNHQMFGGRYRRAHREIMSLMVFPLAAVLNSKITIQSILDGEDHLTLGKQSVFSREYKVPQVCKGGPSTLRTLERFPVGFWSNSLVPD